MNSPYPESNSFATITREPTVNFFQTTDQQAFLTPDAFVVYPSRGKLVLMAIGCIALTACAVAEWLQGSLEYRIVALAAGAFFGLVFLLIIMRLVKPSPALIVNYSGILDNSSALGGYFLRWEEIDSVFISSMTVSMSRQRFLSITVKDTDRFLSQQGTVKAKMMRANIKLVGAPVNISANMLSIRLEELLEVIKQKSAPAHLVAVQP